jgi:hypothetical protein
MVGEELSVWVAGEEKAELLGVSVDQGGIAVNAWNGGKFWERKGRGS